MPETMTFRPEIERVLDDLKQRLDVCREELARRNDATEQLAKSQLQLANAREEILELREKFDEQRESGNADLDDQRERIALETELEMVRRRAAELSETPSPRARRRRQPGLHRADDHAEAILRNLERAR